MKITKRLKSPETHISIVFCLLIAYCMTAGFYGIFGVHTPYSWLLVVGSALTTVHAVVVFVLEKLNKFKGLSPLYISLCVFITGTFILLLCEKIRAFHVGVDWYRVVYDSIFYLWAIEFLQYRMNFVQEALTLNEIIRKESEKR